MNLKIIYDKENKLLLRRRVAFEVAHEKASTPKKEDLKKEIAKFLKIEENLIVMKHVYSKFGADKSKIITHVYEDEKLLKTLDSKKEKVRKDGKEESKK